MVKTLDTCLTFDETVLVRSTAMALELSYSNLTIQEDFHNYRHYFQPAVLLFFIALENKLSVNTHSY